MKQDIEKNITIKVKPIKINITPYALAKIAKDLYRMADSYKEEGFSLAKYSAYLASIEKGLKASILSKDCGKLKIRLLKNEIGHDLEKTIDEFELTFNNIFSEEDKQNIKKINGLYRQKGFDYFTFDMLIEMTKAYKNLPELKVIQGISSKVNKFLKNNKLFINIENK